MTVTQSDKGARFRELHQRPGAFVIANAWDAGSARVLAGLGFEAIATSSGAFANTLGRLDGAVTRDEVLAHARFLCDAIDAPVAADLENGFGDDPATRPRRFGSPPARSRRWVDRGFDRRSAKPPLRSRAWRPSVWPPRPRRRARCRSPSC